MGQPDVVSPHKDRTVFTVTADIAHHMVMLQPTKQLAVLLSCSCNMPQFSSKRCCRYHQLTCSMVVSVLLSIGRI